MRGLYVKRPTLNDLFCLFFLVLLIVLSGGNTQNPDLWNYERAYSTVKELSVEGFIYYFLSNQFLKLGIQFPIFRLCLYAGGLIILHSINKKLTQKAPLFYVLYFASLVMIDTTQTFNFLGMIFLLLGIASLSLDKKNGTKKFLICTVVAVGFHFVFILYLPFAYFYRVSDRKLMMKIMGVFISIAFTFSIVSDVTGLTILISKVLNQFDRITTLDVYLSSRTRYGHFLPIGMHLMLTLLSYYYYRVSKFNQDEELGDNNTIQRIALMLNLYGIMFFPLFRIQLTLARLTRNMVLVTIFAGLDLKNKSKVRNTRLILAISLVIFACLQGYYSVYSSYFTDIVIPFFERNWILYGN
ncbi:MAG: EpsG family protein [Oliverpabstia sp.]|nr:EpsG family protein [Oliverpabstia sp.]